MGDTSSQVAGAKFFPREVTTTFSLVRCVGLAKPLKGTLFQGEQNVLSPWFRCPLFL